MDLPTTSRGGKKNKIPELLYGYLEIISENKLAINKGNILTGAQYIQQFSNQSGLSTQFFHVFVCFYTLYNVVTTFLQVDTF